MKRLILDAAEDPSSELRLRVRDGLLASGARLATDAELRAKVDGWLEDAAGYVVRHYRREITTLITDTVARWDAEETSRKIELQVGRDLQFIRINGTVVGALAGLVIYTVGQLALRPVSALRVASRGAALPGGPSANPSGPRPGRPRTEATCWPRRSSRWPLAASCTVSSPNVE